MHHPVRGNLLCYRRLVRRNFLNHQSRLNNIHSSPQILKANTVTLSYNYPRKNSCKIVFNRKTSQCKQIIKNSVPQKHKLLRQLEQNRELVLRLKSVKSAYQRQRSQGLDFQQKRKQNLVKNKQDDMRSIRSNTDRFQNKWSIIQQEVQINVVLDQEPVLIKAFFQLSALHVLITCQDGLQKLFLKENKAVELVRHFGSLQRTMKALQRVNGKFVISRQS